MDNDYLELKIFKKCLFLEVIYNQFKFKNQKIQKHLFQ